MTTFEDIKAGTIVRILPLGRQRTRTVRVQPGRVFRNVVDDREYASFPGIRVRPDDTSVSFGLTQGFTAGLSRIEVIQGA
jgi:hypothetical protein